MKTDDELRERLRRASDWIRPLEDPLEGLIGRRALRRRRQRLASATIGLVLVAGIVWSAVALIGGGPNHRTGLGRGSGGPELAPGQYFYLRQVVIAGPGGDGTRTIQETWWAPDGS